MSFVNEPLLLNDDAPRPSHKFKLCDKCLKSKPPEGGIEMSKTKWICAVCWTRKAILRRDK